MADPPSKAHPQPCSRGREQGAMIHKPLPSLVITREGRRGAAAG
jgi:hypothetical protein